MITPPRLFRAAVFISLLIVSNVNAQFIKRLTIHAGGGLGWYLGDLQPSVIPFKQTIGLSGQAAVGYQFLGRFGAVLNYQYNLLRGNDGYAQDTARRNRNLGFFSHTHEASLRITYDILRQDKWRSIPYLFVGVGMFMHNPKAFDGTALHPLGTEGQYIGSSDYPKPYKLNNVSVPFGIGYKHRIACNISLKAEFTYHKTFTDYIDDVSSKTYPNEVTLAATPNGQQAVRYSDRRLTTEQGKVFGSRGNSDAVDNYLDFTFGVIFHFGKCRKGRGGVLENCKQLYKNVDWNR